MKENTIKFTCFMLGASFFFLSQIFLLVQGIFNYKYYKMNNKKNIVERTLFEQFSEEVYENINTPFSLYSFKDNCPEYNEFQLSLNLDTFYDCRGIYTDDLREECQDSIIKNYTYCSNNYVNELNFDRDRELLNYENRINYDKRIVNCHYFSRYSHTIINLDNKYICKTYGSLSYEQLLKESFPLYDYNGIANNCPEGKKKCGILDTKNNILCLDETLRCPNNTFSQSFASENDAIHLYDRYIKGYNELSKKIITSVIISENKPMSHEWKKYVRETFNKLNEKEKSNRKNLTKKDFGLLIEEDDNTYEKLGFQIKVSEINQNKSFLNIQSSKYNMEQNLNIYTRNYIGFKNLDELNDFKSKFNEKDPTDNPLYKLSSSDYNPIITIIFSGLLLLLDIIYMIFIIISWKKENNNYNSSLIKAFLVINSLFIAAVLFIIVYHFLKYPKINIDMDDRMKAVLDLYNKRIMSLQKYRITSLAFSVVSLIFTPLKLSNNENQGGLIE